MNQCLKDMKKRTLIITGGPGTGKSVLAINLLKQFISKQLNASYVTKNMAPRKAYLKLLSKSDLKKEVNIEQLFRSPFGLSKSPSNFYDCLIIDEAHRLVKQMFRDYKGKNQVMECINSSLLSIFLIDENQRITTKDIGSVDEIKYWAKELGSRVIMNDETVLVSQFRCNGSDLYIQFLNNLLQIDEYVDIDITELNFDIEVFDDPILMRDELRKKNQINNKARMVAGYCYDWNVKFKRADFDIYLEDGFKARWNLDGD
jgi:adenylate kinase